MRMCLQRSQFPLLRFGLILLTMLVYALPAQATERTVARITDLQGTATLVDNTQSGNLRILARVRSGNRIRLDSGGSLTLHFPENRTDYRFLGPDMIRVEEQRAISDSAATETRTHSDIGVTLDLTDTDLGAISMRSISFVSPPLTALGPVDTRVLLAKPVEFRWRGATSSGLYNLVLKNSLGEILHNQTTSSTSVVMPTHVKLDPGGVYRWQVTTIGTKGSTESANAEFSAAPTPVETLYYRLAGLKTGSISDRVLYALYLDRMNLNEEAREAWGHLETLRPGIQSERGMQE